MHENIVALATAPKNSAINLVRCSGTTVFNIFKTLTKQKKNPEANAINLFLLYCPQTKKVIDQCLVSAFHGPKSYTGENMIEISTHGGELICKRIIDAILKLNCGLAGPGEFTYRAFINGKIDLIQAESINTLINTENNIENNLSLKNIVGGLSSTIKVVEKDLINIIAHMEHELDFNDIEIDTEDGEKYLAKINKIYIKVDNIIKNSFLTGEKNTQIKFCFAGKPNVGKSSLFNLLLGYNRAIVNKAAGTTRDTLIATHTIKDINIELVDTAGIRKTSNSIEKEGVLRSLDAIKQSTLVLFVDDKNPALEWGKLKIKDKDVCLIQNKVDIHKQNNKNATFYTSCKTKKGISKLLTHLLTYIENRDGFSGGFSLLNVRQKNSLKNLKKHLFAAQDSYLKTEDLVVFLNSLYSALDTLKSLRGTKKDVNIINKIFEGFCVGK